ncbi:MAG: hypothetical protein KAS70_01760 [Planctomycetes bacterium]|nr:hypothetical protein [Planctomycetota bacterium]
MKKKQIIERKGVEVDNWMVTWKEEEFKYKIQQPTFEQLSASLAESVGLSGKLNMAGGGKVIWEMCCLEFDEAIEKHPRVLLSVCIDLYNEYVLPADTEIKKK